MGTLLCIYRSELRTGDAGLSFGNSDPAAGPGSTPSPAPIVTNTVDEPRTPAADGPDGAASAPAPLMPDGRPSTNVFRVALVRSINEIRPLFFAVVPDSAT